MEIRQREIIENMIKIYSKEVNKEYSFLKQIKFAIIFSVILLIVDKLNIPSSIIEKYGKAMFYIVLLFIFIFAILTLIENGLQELIRMPFINELDLAIPVVFYSIVAYLIGIFIINEVEIYKLVIDGLLIIILLILFVVRKKYHTKNTITERKINTIDLKDLYEGDLTQSDLEGVLLNEKDVDYDLLNRSSIIEELSEILIKTEPNNSFVISLEGSWGSGKTTILNNVKKQLKEQENIIIIDDFDPWSFGNEEAIFREILDLVLKELGFKYKSLQTKRIIEEFANIILDKNKNVFYSLIGKSDINSLKNKIRSYIEIENKKIIFIIDNIDRADEDNVIFLFKIIGNILNLDGIIYVLSFDDERVKAILEKNLEINYDYLKKIIQLQLRVPEMEKDSLGNVYTKSLANLLKLNNVKDESLNIYEPIVQNMVSSNMDIRDFKRFVNSVVRININRNHYLYMPDLLAIEYIKLFNYSLYKDIYDNRKYFISVDTKYDSELSRRIDLEKFKNEIKQFFENLFKDEKNIELINLVIKLFPKISDYIPIEIDYSKDFRIVNYKETIQNKRIISARFFGLYFTKTSNAHVNLIENLKNLINIFNDDVGIDEKKEEFFKLLGKYTEMEHKVILQNMQVFIEDIKESFMVEVAKILFWNIKKINNSLSFDMYPARSVARSIIWELLKNMPYENYKGFLKELENRYDIIYEINGITHWSDNTVANSGVIDRRDKLKGIYTKIGQGIINNSINLYDDKYYSDKNALGLYFLYNENKEMMEKYVKENVNEKNIYRFLFDCIGYAFSESYAYFISKDRFEALTTEEEVDKILENRKPITEDEKFVLEVYEKYKSGEKDFEGRSSIPSEKEKILKL